MKKFYKGVCKLERVLCTICLCSCTISLFVGAVMRTLDLPLNYTTDIALFSFAWCIFLGVGAAYREDKLVYVNVMIDRVPQKWRRAINAVTYLVIAVFWRLWFYMASSSAKRAGRVPGRPSLP